MTGVPGRSGKVSTPEHREAKRRAGQLAGIATREARAARSALALGDLPAGSDDAPDEQETGLPPIEPGRFDNAPFTVSNWMDLKDLKAVELADVKIATARVELERAQSERDQARGKLLTSEQVREREAARTEMILAEIGRLVDAAVATHDPQHQPACRHAMDRAVAEFRAAIAARIRSHK